MSEQGSGYSKPPNQTAVAIFQPPRLPWHDQIEVSFGEIGVTKSTWPALINAIYPAAKTADSVILALSYCKARKLDPFKRPIHIVPVWNSAKNDYDDTIWPGIAELRTTAVRTGQFGGADAALFGEMKTRKFQGETGPKNNKRMETIELTFPEWAQMTVYRITPSGTRVAIAGPRVYWEETYATIGKTELPNNMWQKRTRGQLEKCAEAAALRRAFPEEIGNEMSAEEMGMDMYDPKSSLIEGKATETKAAPPRPKQGEQTGAAAPASAPQQQTQQAPQQQQPKPVPPEEAYDQETGEIQEPNGGGAAAPSQPSQVAPQATKAAAPPPPPPEPKPEPPKPDNYDAYLETMLKEFAAQKKPSDQALTERTFMDSIDGWAEHKMLSAERAEAFRVAWRKRTGQKAAPKKEPAPPPPPAAPPAGETLDDSPPPQTVTAEEKAQARADDYAAWKKSMYDALAGCKTPGEVDTLQDVQGPNFHGDDDKKAFVAACNKRVREIVAAPK